jgi:hypothetical protein
MANGNGMPRIPGFMVGGGVAVSNTAILIGGAALLAALWFMKANKSKTTIPMSDDQIEQAVLTDVYAYAAYPTQIEQNVDRIRAAITRMRTEYRAAGDAFHKKLRDLRDAMKAGTITHEQYRAQHRAAVKEYVDKIHSIRESVMTELGIARRQRQEQERPPTVP